MLPVDLVVDACRKNTLLSATLLCVALSACSSSSSREEPANDRPGDSAGDDVADADVIAARLERVLDEAVSNGLPAVALAIRGDGLVHDDVAGVSDAAQQAGLLTLDDPVDRWLSDDVASGVASSDRITIRQLLNHTSGVIDFQNENPSWDVAFLAGPDRRWDNADALPFFLGQPLHFEPGTDYRYSNSNYVLAALVLEAATGFSAGAAIRSAIIAPLGLQNTVAGTEPQRLSGLVHGYVTIDGEVTDVYPWYANYGIADGGVQASAADLADVVHAVFASDRLLDDAHRDELVTVSGAGTPPSTYALGVTVEPGATAGDAVFAHAGKDPGARADYLHVVSGTRHITIALCASASFGKFDALYDELLASILSTLAGARPES